MKEEFVSLPALIPDKHPQFDLFICDVADAVLKDLHPQMEHPFYSLSKKPETKIRRYEHNGNWFQVTPSVKGLATIYDKDILIYCISQLMAKLKNGEPISKRVRINTQELLMFTNRGTGGKDYKAFCESLDRLVGTIISTNIRTGDIEEYNNFSLIDASAVRRKHGLDGRILWVDVTLSDWVFSAIEKKDVLTLSPDYFRLRRPIERRLYELARKHVGSKQQQNLSVDLLYKKSGSQGTKKRFKQAIKELIKSIDKAKVEALETDKPEENVFPDYDVVLNDDMVTFYSKGTVKKHIQYKGELPSLPPHILEQAKKLAPRYDVYALEADWRAWWANSGKAMPENHFAAFLGFCKQRNAKKPIY